MLMNKTRRSGPWQSYRRKEKLGILNKCCKNQNELSNGLKLTRVNVPHLLTNLEFDLLRNVRQEWFAKVFSDALVREGYRGMARRCQGMSPM
jgi:hypothetical protein